MSRNRTFRKLVTLGGVTLVLFVSLCIMRLRLPGLTPGWLEQRDEQQLLPLIEQTATRHGLPPALIRAVIWKESRFNQFSVGSKGEIGLMQITNGAVKDWARVNQKDTPPYFDLFIPEVNIEIGSWYLKQASMHWNGYASRDILTLAEYNAGGGKVQRSWAPENPADVVTLEDISYPSTREYVRRILEKQRFYESVP